MVDKPIEQYVFFLCKSIDKSTKQWQIDTAQKMNFSIKDFFSNYDQIRSFLRISSHLLKKSFVKNFIFCSV